MRTVADADEPDAIGLQLMVQVNNARIAMIASSPWSHALKRGLPALSRFAPSLLQQRSPTMKPSRNQAKDHLPRKPMNARAQALLELAQYRSLFPEEADDLAALGEQLEHDPGDIVSRKNMRGHITTSAFILDESAMKVLLIHHRLYNRWLPPGGHYEAGELWTSALREAVEETGIRHAQLHDWSQAQGCPVDIDTHRIAARAAKGEPAHFHHDFAYLLRGDSRQPLVAQLEEVLDARWVSLAVAVELGEGRLRRIIGKLAHLAIFPRQAGFSNDR